MDFGISLDPSSVPQRHALYDSDEEDEQTVVQQPELVFVPSAQDFARANTLVLAIDTAACLFIKSCFVLTPLCSLEGSTQAVFKGTYFPKSGVQRCVVSEIQSTDAGKEGGDVVVCLHEKSLKAELVNIWANKLLEKFCPSSVLVLTSLPAYSHLTHHTQELSPQSSFVRTLVTSSWSHILFERAVPLEAPNTLSGEPAAVLTKCQVHNIPAAVTALYTMSSENMSEQVAGFDPLLDHPLLASLTRRSRSEAVKIVKTLEPKPREDLSSLYT